MFLQTELTKEQSGFAAQQIIQQLNQAIEKDDGWEEKICVHTDKWTNKDGTIGIMCYLTAIKHIKCAYSELLEISKALETIMTIKKNEGVNLKALTSFEFVLFQPIINNSLSSYFKDEVTKATEAYEKFGDLVSVTFNDLAIATLAKNGAFQSGQFAQLTLSSNASRKNEEIESDVSVDAHSKKVICEAAPSEEVTLEDPQTYRILVQTKMKRCTTINYYGLDQHPAWTVTPGCAY